MTDTAQIYIAKIFTDKLQELNNNLNKLNSRNKGMRKYYLSEKVEAGSWICNNLNRFTSNGFSVERVDLIEEKFLFDKEKRKTYFILGSIELIDKEYDYLMQLEQKDKEEQFFRTDIFGRFKMMKEMIANEEKVEE